MNRMNTMPAYVATSNLKEGEVFLTCEFHKAWYKRRATQPTRARTALMLKAIRAGIGWPGLACKTNKTNMERN